MPGSRRIAMAARVTVSTTALACAVAGWEAGAALHQRLQAMKTEQAAANAVVHRWFMSRPVVYRLALLAAACDSRRAILGAGRESGEMSVGYHLDIVHP